MSQFDPAAAAEELEAKRGVWGDEFVSPPISASDIRKWAIAVYWPEQPPRLYWDDAYAKTTRWGGIIAPQDFNPFAWPVDSTQRERRRAALGAVPGWRGLNGGQEDTWHAAMRPGDVIRSRTQLIGWEAKQTRLGPALFTYHESEWRNQDGELIKRSVQTAIRHG